MKTTLDIPDPLYQQVRLRAVQRGQSFRQIVLTSLQREMETAPDPAPVSQWAIRQLLPEYEAALQSGAFSGGTDSTLIISEDRDAR